MRELACLPVTGCLVCRLRVACLLLRVLECVAGCLPGSAGRAARAPALAWAFAYFFLLLCSYYILRPVRDTLAIELGKAALQDLFLATFAVMLALVPVFGWLCARLPRTRLLPVSMAFFAANLGVFCFRLEAQVLLRLAERIHLFVVSVFGASCRISSRRHRRRACTAPSPRAGSCGAIAGPLVAALGARALGTRGLLVFSALVLLATVVCIAMLARWARAIRDRASPRRIRRSAAASSPARAPRSPRPSSPVCGYLFCYTALSTRSTSSRSRSCAVAVPDAGERTRLLRYRRPLACELAGARRAESSRSRA